MQYAARFTRLFLLVVRSFVCSTYLYRDVGIRTGQLACHHKLQRTLHRTLQGRCKERYREHWRGCRRAHLPVAWGIVSWAGDGIAHLDLSLFVLFSRPQPPFQTLFCFVSHVMFTKTLRCHLCISHRERASIRIIPWNAHPLFLLVDKVQPHELKHILQGAHGVIGHFLQKHHLLCSWSRQSRQGGGEA